jgi:hypothetical protein
MQFNLVGAVAIAATTFSTHVLPQADIDEPGRPLVRAAGSTAPGSSSRKCKASGELTDGTMAGQLPPAQPLRSSSPPDRARRQTHRSCERGHSRQ